MKTVRILIAEDSLKMGKMLASFLGDSVAPRVALEIAGQAWTGAEAVRRAAEWSPDLVLMDVSMPEMDGLEATRRIKALPAPPRVLALSAQDSPADRDAARLAGADGFVSKWDIVNSLPPEILRLFPDAERSGS